MKRLLIFIISGFLSFTLMGEELTLKIKGIESQKGEIKIALYNSEDGFPTKEDKASKSLSIPAKSDSLIYSFEGLEYGEYAISIYHDENENNEFDMTWFFKPKEGYGTSNNAKGKFGPPKFEDAKFSFNETNKQVLIKMNY